MELTSDESWFAGTQYSGVLVGMSHCGKSIKSWSVPQYCPMMINRLRTALAEKKQISGADASFYIHELSEYTKMKGGLDYSMAHGEALKKYQVSPYSVYHPDVIEKLNKEQPGYFNSNWLKFWSGKK